MSIKIITRILSFIVLLSVFQSKAQAQVKGLSYNLSPFAEKSWFNEKSGMSNGYLAGAQLGLGFGEFVELRGVYSQGFNLSTDITRFGLDLTDIDEETYTQRDVTLKRYGTEMKLNLLNGPLLPYITLGTGIQSLEADSLGSSKQVYINSGLGIKFSAANRYTIGLQAIRTSYRSNPLNTFMDNAERAQYNITNEEFATNNLSNWSLRASLVLYLGGRNPNGLTDIDKAYLDNFSGGLSGLSIPVEPTVMKINFHEDLNLRDTWMAGGSAGLNLGPLVGVRGFYWRALEDGSATKFESLSMYGGEARFKLNEGKGFTPWLTIGGGEINPSDEYVGRNDVTNIEDKPFAMAGIGVDLPFNKFVKATGFARSILTSADEVADVVSADDIKNSWSYGVSLNFILGRKPKNIQKVQQNAFDSTTELLKQEYEDQIEDLEQQMIGAVNNSDINAVKQIEQKKADAQKIITDLDQQSVKQNSPTNNRGIDNSEIRLSPAEFQLIIRDIIDGLKRDNSYNGSRSSAPIPPSYNDNNKLESAINNLKMEQKLESLDEKLADIEKRSESLDNVIYDIQSSNVELTQNIQSLMQSFEKDLNNINRSIDELDKRNKQLDRKNKEIDRKINSNEWSSKAKKPIAEENNTESIQLYDSLDDTNDRIDELELSIISALENMGNAYAYTETNSRSSNKSRNKKKLFQPKNSNRNKVAQRQEKNMATEKEGSFFSRLQYRGMSAFAGFNVGGNATANIGYRLHYGLNANSNTELMPETFFGLGSPSSFGIMANMTRSFPGLAPKTLLKPYAGIGAGLMKVGNDQDQDQLKGAYNLMVGSYLKVMNGDLYVDFTTRNLFSYNQLIIGYRLPF